MPSNTIFHIAHISKHSIHTDNKGQDVVIFNSDKMFLDLEDDS